MTLDRLQEAFADAVSACLPPDLFYSLFRAKVVAQSADLGTIDATPDDPRLPSMGAIPLAVVAGLKVKIDLRAGAGDAFVLIGWSGGDPSKPYALPFGGGGVQIVLNADQVALGGEAGAEPAVKGATLQAFLDQLSTALVSHVHSGVTTGPGSSGPAPALAAVVAPAITTEKTTVT